MAAPKSISLLPPHSFTPEELFSLTRQGGHLLWFCPCWKQSRGKCQGMGVGEQRAAKVHGNRELLRSMESPAVHTCATLLLLWSLSICDSGVPVALCGLLRDPMLLECPVLVHFSVCSQGLVPLPSCCSHSWVLRGAGPGARAGLGVMVQKRLSTWSQALMAMSA